MRGIGRAGWVVALAATYALSLGPGSAAGATKPQLGAAETLIASGALIYTWHGDPARGCAAFGLCNVQGELVLRAPAATQFAQFGPRGFSDIFVQTAGTVRVVRAGPGGGECVDVLDEGPPGLDIRFRSRGPGQATVQPPGSGRCAGPLQSDLAALKLPVRGSGGRRPSFDLRTSRAFAAGPFSGSFVSTLRLRPAPSQNFGGFSGSFFSSSSGPSSSRSLLEYAQLVYRVTASGGIQTQFAGANDGACLTADSCGAAGSLDLSVQPGRSFTIFASRVVHRRLSPAQVRRDLSRGRLTPNGFATLAGSVGESYSWSDGSSCRDAIPTPPLQLVLGPPPGPRRSSARETVTLMSATGPGPGVEIMRTHCPGPTDEDLGLSSTLATGSLPTRALLAKHLTLDLTERSGFSGLGYTGSPSGSIQLSLTLTNVRAATSGGP